MRKAVEEAADTTEEAAAVKEAAAVTEEALREMEDTETHAPRGQLEAAGQQIEMELLAVDYLLHPACFLADRERFHRGVVGIYGVDWRHEHGV